MMQQLDPLPFKRSFLVKAATLWSKKQGIYSLSHDSEKRILFILAALVWEFLQLVLDESPCVAFDNYYVIGQKFEVGVVNAGKRKC